MTENLRRKKNERRQKDGAEPGALPHPLRRGCGGVNPPSFSVPCPNACRGGVPSPPGAVGFYRVRNLGIPPHFFGPCPKKREWSPKERRLLGAQHPSWLGGPTRLSHRPWRSYPTFGRGKVQRRFRQRWPSWLTIENKVAAACGGVDSKYRLTTSMEQGTPSPTADSGWVLTVTFTERRRGRRPRRPLPRTTTAPTSTQNVKTVVGAGFHPRPV